MKETLSAWMDSELSGEHAGPLLPQLKRDAELRRNWDCYHLIGDALRGVHGPDLCAGIRARLDAEPTVLAPQRRRKPEKLRWAALSVAASAAAVVFVGWMVLSGTQQDSVQVAAAPAAEVKQVAVPAGEGAKDYLLAHQRYSPSSAMQGVAPYVRTVAEQRGSARR
ncbi:MAG: sigma-E factor negative regulatory protein [Sulfuritalea sp.]|nr:sigma-E factor negative regulatory protein [Betaproteobacteria bacterium]MDZ4255272.1 sigma-E factor negative regulatory protein [Sulfuritalea sp.]